MKKILTVTLSFILLILLVLGTFIYIDNSIFQSKTFCDYLNPNLGGAGVIVSLDDNKPIIAQVLVDMPAQKAGIKEGDYVLKVNNKEVKDVSDVIKNMRGKIGTQITVTTKRNDEINEYKLIREKILVNNGYFKLTDNVFLRQNYLKYEDGIYYFYAKVYPCPCNQVKNKKEAYKEEFIAINPKENKILKLEIKSFDKNDKLIKTKTTKETKENYKEITPEDYGCVFINFINDIDTTIAKRYKNRLKGSL